MTATIVERDHPEQNGCAECGSELDFDHFIVTTTDGALCTECANDTVPGLGDTAHGLSLLKWALLYDITQDRRLEVQGHLAKLTQITGDLHSGKTMTYAEDSTGVREPLRPGGTDPHTTIRRHTLRAVGEAR